ncbi:hypothetical protein Leryth_013282 [Lithospermum erythrorhizon]|nr:hypothetical protein Leryth_013282 [Lithospermum erythrorhizon]
MEKLVFQAATEGNVASLLSVLQQDPLILDRIIANCFPETPLHVAALLGHVHVVEELVRRKPELTKELNSNGSTPLHLASARGYDTIVRALVLVDPETCLVQDKDGRNPLHLAAIKGRVEILKELIRVKPEAAKMTFRRGESILHLCVMHNQLEVLKFLIGRIEDQEFLNCKDDYGNSILHLAVAHKHIETLNYLLTNKIEVNAENIYGLTALDILIQSRRDIKDMEIIESLNKAGASSGTYKQTKKATKTNPQKRSNNFNEFIDGQQDWLERKRNVLMIVASLIATMAFQVGVNPPGGYWQETSNVIVKSGKQVRVQVGHSIWADNEPETYASFIFLNTTGFIASLSIILLLISGLPIRRRGFIWILMMIMWVAITAVAFTYINCVVGITNCVEKGVVLSILVIVVLVWIGLMSLLVLGHSIRLIVRGVKAIRDGRLDGTRLSSWIKTTLQGIGYGNDLPA